MTFAFEPDMSLLLSVQKDVLPLILRHVCISDIGSLAQTCRTLRNVPYILTSIDIPAYLMAVRDVPAQEIAVPNYQCTVEGCSNAGSEANFGYCSTCVKEHEDPELREQSRTAWLAKKKEEDARYRAVWTDRFQKCLSSESSDSLHVLLGICSAKRAGKVFQQSL